MKTVKLIIFGGGVMGSALAEQIVRARIWRRSDLLFVERHAERTRVLRKKGFVVHSVATREIMKHARLVLLAVKPQDATPLLQSLRGQLSPGTLVVSIMAGISLQTLQLLLGHRRTIRCMPNLAATVGLGMTAWLSATACSAGDRRLAQKIFRAFGAEIRVKSDDALDRLTAVSGSGPGYLFAVARDIVRAVQALGFTKNEAHHLVKQTLVGAAELYKQSELAPDELFQRVASKGGTTEAANNVLVKGHSAATWTRALRAAYQRARQLSQRLDKASRQG